MFAKKIRFFSKLVVSGGILKFRRAPITANKRKAHNIYANILGHFE